MKYKLINLVHELKQSEQLLFYYLVPMLLFNLFYLLASFCLVTKCTMLNNEEFKHITLMTYRYSLVDVISLSGI